MGKDLRSATKRGREKQILIEEKIKTTSIGMIEHIFIWN